MNRVHEQCPKIGSGTIPSQFGSKTGRVHRVHSPKPARSTPGRSPSAQVAHLPRPTARVPCSAVARLRLRPTAARLPLVRALACASVRTPTRLPPCGPQLPRLRAQRLPSCLAFLSQYNFVFRYNFASYTPFQPQYKTLYCNTISCSLVTCNINPAIQS